MVAIRGYRLFDPIERLPGGLKCEGLVRFAHIQVSSQLAFWLAGVSHELTIEINFVGDQMCQVLNRNRLSCSDTDGFVGAPMLGHHEDGAGRAIHIEQLSSLRAIATY